MAIAVTGSGQKGYGVSDTVSCNIPVGATLFMASWLDQASPAISATIGGNALTMLLTQTFYYNQASVRIGYYVSPPTGGSVSLTFSTDGTVGGWLSFSGSSTSAPFNGSTDTMFLDESGTLTSSRTISGAAGEMLASFAACLGGDGTTTGYDPDNSATERVGLFDSYGCAIMTKDGGSSVAIGAVPVGTGISYWSVAQGIVRINPDSGGGGATVTPAAYFMRRRRQYGTE